MIYFSNKLHILVSEKTEAHLPMCEINHNRNLHSTLRKFMTVINYYFHQLLFLSYSTNLIYEFRRYLVLM